MISLNNLRNKCTRLWYTSIILLIRLVWLYYKPIKLRKNMGSHLWFPSSPPNLNLDRPRSSAISRLHLIGSLLWSFPLGTLSGTFMDLIMLLFLRTSLFLIGLDVLSPLEHIQSSKSFTLRNGFPHNFNSLFPLENPLNWLRCKCASGMSTRTV